MKSISLREAKINAAAEMSKPITALGFDHREVGPYIVNILYYSARYQEGKLEWTEHRADVYVNGQRSNGLLFR